MWHCQYSSTYFLEIYKGPRNQNAKIYESEWNVDEVSKHYNINISDAHFCDTNPDMPIEFKFINRNQYMMINTEVAFLMTTLGDLKLATGGRTL